MTSAIYDIMQLKGLSTPKEMEEEMLKLSAIAIRNGGAEELQEMAHQLVVDAMQLRREQILLERERVQLDRFKVRAGMNQVLRDDREADMAAIHHQARELAATYYGKGMEHQHFKQLDRMLAQALKNLYDDNGWGMNSQEQADSGESRQLEPVRNTFNRRR